VNETRVPARYALLVGISDYRHRPPLHGCINDLELTRGTLRDRYGFELEHIHALKNDQATREAILAAMVALEAKAGPEDLIVFQFSGCGSQIRPPLGVDGWVDTLMPFDSGRGNVPNRDITGDEIRGWLARLAERRAFAVLVLDCCFVGTIVRDAYGAASRLMPPEERRLDAPREEPAKPPASFLERVLVITASRAEETAHEYPPQPAPGDQVYGALTYFLNRALLRAAPQTIYLDVFEQAAADVTATYPDQHPQILGAIGRVVLESHGATHPVRVAIAGRSGDRVELSAGSVQGLTVGSVWAIFHALVGLGAAAGATAAVGRLAIESVGPRSASGRLVEESDPGAVVAGLTALEVEHCYGDLCLKVDLPTPADLLGLEREALAARIDKSPLIRRACDGEAADVRALLLGPRSGAMLTDPAPQLGALPDPTWAVIGGGGQVLLPPLPAGRPDTAARLVAGLERFTRYRNLLALRNADLGDPLAGAVDFFLLRRHEDDGWVEATPDDSGRVAYRTGDLLAFRIRNRHSAPIFVTVLDFGLTYGLRLLHPTPPGDGAVEPGSTIDVGVDQSSEMKVFVPKDFPGDEGLDSIKLIAATRRVDLVALANRADHGDRAEATDVPLERLLMLASWRARDGIARIGSGQKWTTRERSFLVRRGE
jgi:Caspase domain